MPELPEVETVVRGLRPDWEKNTLERVETRRSGLRWAFPPDFSQKLAGRTINALKRRAKYILADLDDGQTLLIHLGMTGRLTHHNTPLGQFVHNTQTYAKHDHVIFYFSNGTQTIYNDVRRFGAMDIFTDTHPLLASLGHEPLDSAFTSQKLRKILKTKKPAIKSVLLDQRYVTGLGNIYVCEALFQSGIHPSQPAHSISAARITKLYAAIQDVLYRAIEAGGSTLKDYRHTDGSLGYFQHTFSVYGREGEICTHCQSTVERFSQSGRSTFFCPLCQALK